MERVHQRFTKKESKGDATVVPFELTLKDIFWDNLYAIQDGNEFAIASEGKFVKLVVGKSIVMSDTDMEIRTNIEFVSRANGDVLIAGLGIGLIINAIKDKPEVKSITVVEVNQNVIDLILPKYSDVKNLTVVCADIHTWNPPQKYDTIYFDIWNEVHTKNLPDISFLHNRYKNKLNRNNPNAYMDSWVKGILQARRRKEREDEKFREEFGIGFSKLKNAFNG